MLFDSLTLWFFIQMLFLYEDSLFFDFLTDTIINDILNRKQMPEKEVLLNPIGAIAMNYNLLYYFRVLGDTEHFGQASKILCIEQPSLSQSMKRLEMDLGIALFKKQGRNIALTEAGRSLHKKVCQAFDLLNYAEQELAESRGLETVVISSTHSQAGKIPLFVTKFLQIPGNQDIHVSIFERHTPESFEALKNNQCDLIVCSFQDPSYDFSYLPITRLEAVLYVPQDHPLAKFDQIDLRDAMKYKFVYPCPHTGMHIHVERLFKEINCKPSIAVEAESISVLLSLVSDHVGIALCPRQTVLFHSNLKALSLTNKSRIFYHYMAFPANKPLSRAARKFRDFVADAIEIDIEKAPPDVR